MNLNKYVWIGASLGVILLAAEAGDWVAPQSHGAIIGAVVGLIPSFYFWLTASEEPAQ